MSKRARATDTEAPRQNRARAVSELLPAIHGAAFKRFGFVQSALVTRWPEIVGERWAAASAHASGQKTAQSSPKVIESTSVTMAPS